MTRPTSLVRHALDVDEMLGCHVVGDDRTAPGARPEHEGGVGRATEAHASEKGRGVDDELARLAVDETGYSVYGDKIVKNKYNTIFVAASMLPMRTIGVLWVDERNRMMAVGSLGQGTRAPRRRGRAAGLQGARRRADVGWPKRTLVARDPRPHPFLLPYFRRRGQVQEVPRDPWLRRRRTHRRPPLRVR